MQVGQPEQYRHILSDGKWPIWIPKSAILSAAWLMATTLGHGLHASEKRASLIEAAMEPHCQSKTTYSDPVPSLRASLAIAVFGHLSG